MQVSLGCSDCFCSDCFSYLKTARPTRTGTRTHSPHNSSPGLYGPPEPEPEPEHSFLTSQNYMAHQNWNQNTPPQPSSPELHNPPEPEPEHTHPTTPISRTALAHFGTETRTLTPRPSSPGIAWSIRTRTGTGTTTLAPHFPEQHGPPELEPEHIPILILGPDCSPGLCLISRPTRTRTKTRDAQTSHSSGATSPVELKPIG